MPRLNQLLRVSVISAAVTLLCVGAASAESLGVGEVNADGLRMRAEASTDSSILTMANTGDCAVVVEDAGDGWYKVDFQGEIGYMYGEYLDVSETAEADLGYGKVDADGSTLNVRKGPGTDHDRVDILNDGAVVELLGMEKGWFHIKSGETEGYVSSDYVVTCADSSGVSYNGSLGEQIVAYAKQYLGVPYVWGGNGPNCFDCSGFSKYVYAHFGYTLNRTASAQLNNGVAVTWDQLQPGDLFFLNNGRVSTPVSHVGIYIGGGEFIHASSNSMCVEISSIYGHYGSQFVYARRII